MQTPNPSNARPERPTPCNSTLGGSSTMFTCVSPIWKPARAFTALSSRHSGGLPAWSKVVAISTSTSSSWTKPMGRSLGFTWPSRHPIAKRSWHSTGLPSVLAGVMYSSLGGLLAASMKILRIGQNASQTLLTEALAQAPAIIALAMTVPFDEIGWFNPWLDIAAARHETADGRMFIS